MIAFIYGNNIHQTSKQAIETWHVALISRVKDRYKLVISCITVYI